MPGRLRVKQDSFTKKLADVCLNETYLGYVRPDGTFLQKIVQTSA